MTNAFISLQVIKQHQKLKQNHLLNSTTVGRLTLWVEGGRQEGKK